MRKFFKFTAIKDIRNYRKWIKTIDEEKRNPDSKFNQFGLDHNSFYILYLVASLGEEEKALPETVKRMRLMENLTSLHRYLDEDLGFANYVIPEFSQFYDDQNNPTLSYGVVYKFAFEKISVKYLITRLLFWTGVIFATTYFNLIPLLISLF